MPKPWRWVTESVIMAAHAEQLAEHGGLDGLRDVGLLQSALARPENLAAYGSPDAAALAAAYAFGIARNHPFADGNKRAALIAAEGFLNLNGFELDASNAELVMIFLELAAGELSEEALSVWFRARLRDA